MKNIFSQTKDYVKPPKRNVFDLSFVNHSTFNFGTLYPVFCKPVIPGDSFKIDTTFALRFMPTAFPIQTKITANLHFFYVRNRNLWDKWQKFIGHTGNSGEFPYIDTTKTPVQTSALADYLGVPTTLVGDFRTVVQIENINAFHVNTSSGVLQSYDYNLTSDGFFRLGDLSLADSGTTRFILTSLNGVRALSSSIHLNAYVDDNTDTQLTFSIFLQRGDEYKFLLVSTGLNSPVNNPVIGQVSDVEYNLISSGVQYASLDGTIITFYSISQLNDYLSQFLEEESDRIVIGLNSNFATRDKFPIIPYEQGTEFNPNLADKQFVSSYAFYGSQTEFVNEINENTSPFNSAIRLNALPFRAYESIYNAFYRNEQNDPFMINNQPEYDKYIANNGSGLDSFPYKLYNRNWELDFLTSAVQSPQQGIAPLVGVSMQGDFTFANKDSDGNVGYFAAKAQYDTDGNITGFQLSDKVTVNGEIYTDTTNVPDDVKRGTIYNLNQMALGGISINDFRNVNALQRWLETNIRRGYKYRDIIKSHFGVDVDYNILDMPEFIGGISEPVFSTQVNQTTETDADPLGSYAGQLSLIAKSNHTIKHYCDEHGYIIGIMSIVPTPCYSQLLPKDFIKSNYLDYYFPEFGHIGMQPIDYREVAPIQVYNTQPKNLLNTFGYQRPWYDYIASVDEVHSLFRTNLRNFVLNRQFDTFPALNKEFLQVDANQLNEIFTVTNTSDKILGQIQFNVIAKRPIPMFGIPRLE